MDSTKEALVERLGNAADRMAHKTRHATMHESMQDWADLDLTMPQLRTMGYLAREPRRMGELAAYLGSSVSSATSLVERLEGKALVQRVHDPIDRRVVMCHLAPAGREVIERFWRMQRLQLESVADFLSVEELVRVVEGVELMVTAFERRAAADAPPAAADTLTSQPADAALTPAD
jgi:DNA-binding MarR family transcriptional regulator